MEPRVFFCRVFAFHLRSCATRKVAACNNGDNQKHLACLWIFEGRRGETGEPSLELLQRHFSTVTLRYLKLMSVRWYFDGEALKPEHKDGTWCLGTGVVRGCHFSCPGFCGSISDLSMLSCRACSSPYTGWVVTSHHSKWEHLPGKSSHLCGHKFVHTCILSGKYWKCQSPLMCCVVSFNSRAQSQSRPAECRGSCVLFCN